MQVPHFYFQLEDRKQSQRYEKYKVISFFPNNIQLFTSLFSQTYSMTLATIHQNLCSTFHSGEWLLGSAAKTTTTFPSVLCFQSVPCDQFLPVESDGELLAGILLVPPCLYMLTFPVFCWEKIPERREMKKHRGKDPDSLNQSVEERCAQTGLPTLEGVLYQAIKIVRSFCCSNWY